TLTAIGSMRSRILSAVESATQLDNPAATRRELSMIRPMWVTPAAITALALIVVVPRGRAQQPPSSGPVSLPDKPQVFRTAAAAIRITAVKGLVYPWALAFLPNGDILVTEQSRNTLRVIRHGVLDAAPITGLPPGITSD